MLRCWVLVFFAPVITQIAGHGAVVSPRPRNAIDRDLSPWSGPVPKVMPGVDAWCPVPQADHLSGENGQACFWFSNGCSIGCPECDGTTRGPIPDEHGFRKKMDVCGKGFNATICDPALRTVNTGAECGAADDWYYFSPWRAPGSSPVFDACGMAGGTWHAGGYGAVYKNTSHAHQGDLGSKVLPKTPTGTTWKQGESYEVAWTVQANHGGGYSYRLCPAGEELTEECFAKTPLDFVGMQSFRWNGDNGTQVWFHGKYVTEGTYPVGSMWAKNPLPRNDTEQTGQSFAPSCEEVPNCGSTEIQSSCLCSGMWGPYNLEVVDRVMTPKHLPPGDYVLGWRWDCEESTQVWTSCSDITIVA